MRKLLIAVIFLAEHGSLGAWASVVIVQGLHSMRDLPGPRIEPVSPALVGRFLTTGPSGKSKDANLNKW